MIALLASAIALSLGPYGGPPRSGSVGASTKFAVAVAGRPSESVTLRAVDVPHAYIASFCTDRVCAPFRVTLVLPKTGRTTIELQLIATADGARPPSRVTVEADGTTRRAIAFDRGTH